MYFRDFDDSDETGNNEMNEDNDLILKETKAFINDLQKKFKEDVLVALCDDIEEWLFERHENVRKRYFNGVVSYLLGMKYRYVKDQKTLEEWLVGIGYDATSLRKKIYEENKEIIDKAIVHDAVHEALKNMSRDNMYFKSWDFESITKGCQQNDVVKNFLEMFVLKDGFNEYINEVVDDEIKRKLKYLNQLKDEIKELEFNAERGW